MIAKRLQVLRDSLGSALPSDAKLGMLVTTAPAVEKVGVEFAERNGLVIFKPGAGKEFNQTEYADKFETAVQRAPR